MDDIAVVMVTYNRRSETVRAIQNLYELPEKPEILLMDNASSDGTSDAVRKRFPEVSVHCLKTNRGAAIRGLGVKLTRRPVIAFCDDDSAWKPGSLAKAAELFYRFPKLGLIAAKVLVGKERKIDPTSLAMKQSPLLSEEGQPGIPVLGFLACGAVVRREAFLACGGFVEELHTGMEELLLAIDMAEKGWWLSYLEDIVAYHYPSETRDCLRRKVDLVRNDLWIAWMRRSPVFVIRKAGRYLLNGTLDPAARRGFCEAVSGFHRVCNLRNPVSSATELHLNRLNL